MKASPPPSDVQPQVSKANMFTKHEVAQKLGVSVRTLDNLVAAREFPPGARVGRFLYWTESAITAWHQRIFAAQLNWRP